ncbi:MAG: hypothetical protein NC433_03560 [Clostridiales bacterium]|nr:hypothetical protein [Clostridiales bacterium]
MYDLIVILCVICGAYMMYAAIMMKYKGKFIKSVVLGNGMDENSLRDKEGFVKYLYIRLLGCGVVDVAIGVACLINDFMNGDRLLSGIANIIFFISIVAYAIFINKALKNHARK